MSNQPRAAAELNALRERLRIPFYLLAPAAGTHPTRLARMLAGREPLPLELLRGDYASDEDRELVEDILAELLMAQLERNAPRL